MLLSVPAQMIKRHVIMMGIVIITMLKICVGIREKAITRTEKNMETLTRANATI